MFRDEGSKQWRVCISFVEIETLKKNKTDPFFPKILLFKGATRRTNEGKNERKHHVGNDFQLHKAWMPGLLISIQFCLSKKNVSELGATTVKLLRFHT